MASSGFKKDIFIFLLDDLFTPNLQSFFQGVTEEYRNIYSNHWNWKLIPHSASILYWLDKSILARLELSKIHLYNINILHTKEFIQQGAKYFSIDEAKFYNLWRSIYEMPKETKDNIASIFHQIQNKDGTMFLVVPEINEIQFNYLLEQLLQTIDPNSQKTGNFYYNNSLYLLSSATNDKFISSAEGLINLGLNGDAMATPHNIHLCSNAIKTTLLPTDLSIKTIGLDSCLLAKTDQNSHIEL